MKNTVLIALTAVGLAMMVREASRRRSRRKAAEERDQITAWEGEGGAVPAPGRNAPAFGREPAGVIAQQHS